ncbi:MAG: ABC transporter substrate-binding protein [Flavobacteriales bacterium]|nr:ABC transporter substrate-binding protein [Flavobacteriales bacterium]MBP9081131.1 ABC transporter substrate-binding protein [Flavobacteriales bacterium]
MSGGPRVGVRPGAWAWLVLFATACSGPVERPAWAGWEREPLQAAEFFQLWKRGSDRLLLTFGPGGTADTTGKFLLVPGKAAGAVPLGASVLPAPLQRVALFSTTHASFLSALGRADAVVGCAWTDRLRDPQVAALARSGRIAEIGTAQGIDRERMLLLAPEALFTYPYGTEGKDGALGALPVVPVAEYLERHPLGRAEWIRAFGMLLGQEEQARRIFSGIAGRYAAAVASVPQDTTAPAVFFGSSWKGAWSVPAGNSYMAQLITDAGGRYLLADRQANGNIDLDLETVLTLGGRAQRWGRILELHRPVTRADVAGDDSRIMALPAFTGLGAFYGNSAESDLFGQAGLEPDVVLRDLIGIVRPALQGDRPFVYFKPVQ